MVQPDEIIAETGEYRVQNFPPPVKAKGGRLREGGKFSPRLYSSPEYFSNLLSPEEFRRTYQQSSEDEGSIVEAMPASRFGTGHRRFYKPDKDDKDKGVIYSNAKTDVREIWGVLYCFLGVSAIALGSMATCA
jgi:hypothetical protein